MIAPAKLNLCLFLGPARADGLHEICSLFQPLELADRIKVEPAAGAEDEVVCPGVEGPNLAARALELLRAAGWSREPLRVEIDKRIPIAAGLGGGSADAAAVLRLARGEVEGLDRLAAEIGSDLPSQLDPGLMLVRGGGEVLEPLPDPGEWAVVLIPDERGLATAEVFAEADRLGIGRERSELERLAAHARSAVVPGAIPLDYVGLLVNDLEPAAVELLPDIAEALQALREVGAEAALMSGSGPTAVGIFADAAAADAAARALASRYPGAIVTAPQRRA